MPIKLHISLLTAKLTAKSTARYKPGLSWLNQLSALALLSALPYTAHSVVTDYSGAPIFKQGYVAARNVVQGPSGQPVYAEIDAYGDVISEIGEAVGTYENAEVMSAAVYLQTFTRYTALIAQYPSYRLSANGKRLYQLDPYGNDVQPALLTSKVNLNLPQDPRVSESTSAVLLSAAGNVLFASNYNIAFRVAMFGLDNGSGGISDAGPGNDKDIIRSPGDQLLGPMTGSMVGYNTYTQFGGIVSETGRYIIEGRIAPCPGFSYTFNGFVFLDLYYRSFNPRAKQPMQSWGMMQSTLDTCTGYSALGALGGNNAQVADNILLEDAFAFEFNNNFIVDLLMITGRGNQLSNRSQGGGSIGIGPTTEYTYTAPSFNKTTQENLDLDGDGITDTQVLVTQDDLETTNPELAVAVAVYLGGDPKQIDPVTNKVINEDLRRQLDIDPDLSHQGLLSQISAADLVDTDILTYRESTGERYSERNKLQGNALTGIGEGGSFSAGIEANGTIYFNTPVLWTSLSTYLGESTFNSPTGSARTYQAASGTSTGASNPNAWKDALRPGEYLNTYFINRRSGYLGMSRVQIDSNANQVLLGTQSPQAELLPPNLKIRVERRSNVEAGITRGETREQLVGFEGSGLTSDTLLVITTEWYAEDGSPLPDDLPGYTARLAKVVKSSGLDRLDDAAPGNFVSQFAITPGTHTKTIYIPEDNKPEHFYIHISGQPTQELADFAPSGQQGILGERPANYVPFKVAVYDEKLTNAARKLARESNADPADVKPIYQWVYRPEMQFSVFDFEMKNIFREGADGERFNYITDLANPVIGSGDTIDVLLSLLEPPFDALTQFGPDRELILAIGEYEIALQPGENQTLILFNELVHFDLLNPEDYLTISLYQNSDSSNVLWEFAFRTLDADVDSDNDDGLLRPDRSPAEELVEAKAGMPGKILSINTDDTDGDGVPDYADFDIGEGFAQFIVEVPNTVDPAITTITFTYNASSPLAITQQTNNGVTEYIPDVGYLRLWTRNGDQARDPNSLTDNGDYLQSGKAYALNQFTIDPDSSEIVLYVEAVRESDTVDNTSVSIELIEN